MKVDNWNYKQGNNSYINVATVGIHTKGYCMNSLGIILVFQQNPTHETNHVRGSKYVRFKVIKDGQVYHQVINGKVYTEDDILVKAVEFIKEVHSGKFKAME